MNDIYNQLALDDALDDNGHVSIIITTKLYDVIEQIAEKHNLMPEEVVRKFFKIGITVSAVQDMDPPILFYKENGKLLRVTL